MMGLTWYLLGVLTGLAALLLHYLSGRIQLTWITWGGLFAGIGALLFCIAWAVGAYLEGVPRAAAMGLLMFGLSGIVILTVTARLITKQNRKQQGETP
jgi:hypothetical protein